MGFDAPWLPNLFYLCLVIGLWVTALGLVAPGTGVLEALALLLLGGAAVGMLPWPVNSLAFIPLIMGAAAFVLSLVRRQQSGLWLLASAILISLGSIFLFESASGGPAVQPVLAIIMSALTVLLFWVGVRRGLEAQQAAPTVAAAALVGLMLLFSAIRVVQEYERLVVFRLGRSLGEKGPGLVILWPFIDRGVKVDLREQVREIPHQTSITKDNAPIAIDFLWYYKVVTAVQTVVQVGSFEAAAQGMATTTLRSVIGGIPLDDVLSQREHINQVLRTKLDEVTERWGVKVTNVEIREIIE